MDNQKQARRVLFLLILVGLLGGLALVLSKFSSIHNLQQKASGGSATVAVVPASGTIPVGGYLDVEIKAKVVGVASVNASALVLNYDPAVVSVTSFDCGTVFQPVTEPVIENGRASIDCYYNPSVGRTYQLQAGTDMVIGRLRLNALVNWPDGQTDRPISDNQQTKLNIESATLIDPVVIAGTETNIVGQVNGGVYTIGGQQAGPVSLYFQPVTGNLLKGVNNGIALMASSSRSVEFSALSAVVSFDPAMLEASSPVCAEGLSSGSSVDNLRGQVTFICYTMGVYRTIGSTPDKLASVNFRVRDTAVVGSQTTLRISEAVMTNISQENFIGNTPPSNYTIVGQLYPIDWKTNYAWLKADDLTITLPNGVKYHGTTTALTLNSDPPDSGDPAYTTLEATWAENNKEMRLYMYFKKIGGFWRSEEIRTYDGNTPGEWIYYRGLYFDKPVGTAYSSPSLVIGSERGDATISFKNIWLNVDFDSMSPTPTPPTGAPVLAFSVKSQGIFDRRANQIVAVKVKKGVFEKTFTGVTLTADAQGVYSGQVTLTGVAPGSGYSIFVKGPKHLAKKMCENNQTRERRCGEVGAITLTSGTNTFNWSQVVMEGGDLPLTNGGQNGVVNSADWTYLNSKLGSTSAVDLAIADINLDGVVNATDRVLLRNTLETKYEEDY